MSGNIMSGYIFSSNQVKVLKQDVWPWFKKSLHMSMWYRSMVCRKSSLTYGFQYVGRYLCILGGAVVYLWQASGLLRSQHWPSWSSLLLRARVISDERTCLAILRKIMASPIQGVVVPVMFSGFKTHERNGAMLRRLASAVLPKRKESSSSSFMSQ